MVQACRRTLVLSRAMLAGTYKETEVHFRRACVDSASKSRSKLGCASQPNSYIQTLQSNCNFLSEYGQAGIDAQSLQYRWKFYQYTKKNSPFTSTFFQKCLAHDYVLPPPCLHELRVNLFAPVPRCHHRRRSNF